jgi:hypothetical protein
MKIQSSGCLELTGLRLLIFEKNPLNLNRIMPAEGTTCPIWAIAMLCVDAPAVDRPAFEIRIITPRQHRTSDQNPGLGPRC